VPYVLWQKLPLLLVLLLLLLLRRMPLGDCTKGL
jgi:hypothetical protein